MKKIKLSLVAISSITMLSSLNANTLSEAISNGKVSADVAVTYESRKQDKEVSTYYSDTAYSVGSIGLNYTTATYNNFSAKVGFRSYTVLYEDDEKFTTLHGNGDSTERIYDENGRTALSRAFIAYDGKMLRGKLGRQLLSDDWMTNVHDALTLYAKPIEDLEIEVIKSQRFGRARARDLRPMSEVNGDSGMSKVGITYKITDEITTNAFLYSASSSHDMSGGKIKYDRELSSGKVGASFHMLETSEKVANTKDGELTEIKVYTTIDGYTGTLGYVKAGKDNGWGSAAKYGFNIVPFEEGDKMFNADAKTTYFKLSKGFDDISLTALYGIMKDAKYEATEFNLWAGYKINTQTKFNLGYASVDEDSKETSRSDLEQINLTVTYNF